MLAPHIGSQNIHHNIKERGGIWLFWWSRYPLDFLFTTFHQPDTERPTWLTYFIQGLQLNTRVTEQLRQRTMSWPVNILLMDELKLDIQYHKGLRFPSFYRPIMWRNREQEAGSSPPPPEMEAWSSTVEVPQKLNMSTQEWLNELAHLILRSSYSQGDRLQVLWVLY